MHHDYHFAVERQGVQDIFLNSPNQGAWLERFVTDWTGPMGRLGRLRFKMRKPIFPGDTMVIEGVVRDVSVDETGCGWVELDLTIRVRDVTCTESEAKVAIPTAPDDNPWDRRAERLGPVGGCMDLDFTPEQDMLREAVAGVCARHCGLDVVRQMEDDPVGYSDKFWEQLAELGLLGMTLPEEHGGSGMTMLDAVVVYTELGRALAPSPHFVSSVMSGGVLALAGSPAQQAEWLPADLRGRGDHHARVAGAGRRVRPQRCAARPRRRRRRLAARRRQAPRAVRAAPPTSSCSSGAHAGRAVAVPRRPAAGRCGRSPSR